MKHVGNKVSYIRHPFAAHSYISLGTSVLCLALTAASLWMSVAQEGQGGMITGALGFSAMVSAGIGLWFSLLSFMEKEKNYILAKISLGICGVILILWVMIIIVGIG